MTAGGAYTLKYATVSQFPIIVTKNTQPIISIVDKILTAKKIDPNADTTKLESKIDRLVYKLYNLTENEIKIIEEQNR
jgi:hypothetical protein